MYSILQTFNAESKFEIRGSCVVYLTTLSVARRCNVNNMINGCGAVDGMGIGKETRKTRM
jgi:hypothetical protein